MQNRKMLILGGMALLLLLCTSTVFGQIVYGQPSSGGARIVYTHWKLDQTDGTENTINQFLVPVTGFFPLKENLEAKVFMASSSNTLDAGSTDYSLNGLSDMRVQISQSVAEDQVLFSLGVNLPTGKHALSLDASDGEALVMQTLTSNYLNFPLRRLGEGFGLNMLVGAAASSENFRYGASMMYELTGAYEAYEGKGDYNPGNMFNITVGIDTQRDRMAYVGDVSFTTFGTDKLEDIKVFRQSRSLDFHAGAIYTAEKYKITNDVRFLSRGRNTTYSYDDSTSVSIEDQLKFYGNEFDYTGAISFPIFTNWSMSPGVDLRLIGDNELNSGSATIFGIGSGFNRAFGQTSALGFALKYYTGSANGGDVDISGYQLSISLMSTL